MKYKSVPTLIRVIKILVFLCMGLTTHAATTLQSGGQYVIKGKVLDNQTDKGLAFAVLLEENSGVGVVCDINGNFTMPPIPAGKVAVKASYLGYASTTIPFYLDKDTTLTIHLAAQSFNLNEVSVVAKYSPQNRGNAVVDQTALEYIQPTSLSDVLQLLPGNILENKSMTRFNLTGLRQVGADVNSSLGMAIVSDGIPLSNDGMRVQLGGLTGEDPSDTYVSDRVVSRNMNVNAGVDMRNLSTDHIESIEIERGISSAKVGNLTTGAIQVHSKQGESPLTGRIKLDPLNKLFYVGKGMKLPKDRGVLHVGMDMLSSTSDIREQLERYTRVTAQENYNNKVTLAGKPLDLNLKLSQIVSVNNHKTDQLVVEKDESYHSQYARISGSMKGLLLLNTPLIEDLEVILSADLSRDLITRHKLVLSSSGPKSMPLSAEAGEHEGVFLPVKYYSDFSIENIPLYAFAQLNATSRFNIKEVVRNRLYYGGEAKITKNFGEGVNVDPTRPPYPLDNTYIRPRANYDIPAIAYGALYLEDKMSIPLQKHSLDFSLGVRATKMFNLPEEYRLSHEIMVEPRLQGQLNLVSEVNGKRMLNVIRAGYGEENKLPTLDLLYPDKVYRDFMVLNAYFQNEALNYLLVNTYVHDPSNPDFRASLNKKAEVGWDLYLNQLEVSLSAFYENAPYGFEYFSSYYPVAFYRYMEPLHPITERPTKEDYLEEYYQDFTQFKTVTNSAKTIKKGIEYRVLFPKIEALSTNVEINGAYYQTVYTKGVPVMYRPDLIEFGHKYPFVGYYEGDTHYYKERFNTTVRFNTHIPSYGLIFTNFFQVVWLSNERKGNEESVYPYSYMDLDGEVHTVTPEEILSDIHLVDLARERTELYYRTERKPVAMRVDFKATKEISEKTRLSFYVNNIIDINPIYKRADQTTGRDWAVSFFGVELMMRL